jgi:hypothetical protein
VVLRSILGWITGRPSWIVEIYKQRAQNKRAAGWLAHTADLPGNLAEGTIYKETTPDGSVEVWKLPVQTTHVSVILDPLEPEINSRQPPEIQPQQPKGLTGEGALPTSDPSTHGKGFTKFV